MLQCLHTLVNVSCNVHDVLFVYGRHKDAHDLCKRRKFRHHTRVDFLFPKTDIIVGFSETENVMFRCVGLKDNSALFFRSSCSSRNLRYKLEGAFARTIIAEIKRGIGFQNTDESNVSEIVSFRNHLRTHKHVRFLIAESRQDFEIAVLSHRSIVVHTQHSHAGNKVFQLFNHFFGADSALFYLVASAIWALG